ncbi:MULE transposase, conserved domain protein, partial [mine drainage metagenome]
MEIQERFREQGLPTIPLRTIQRLTDRFVLYHTATHLESLPRLREALEEFGGYVLVLDGTGAAGKMTLVLTDDDDSGGTGWVLLAAPIAEESVVRVTPHLERLKRGLGPPVTGISDQSAGLRDSFRGVFPGVYLLLCQFHVLRSIGESLAGKRYARFKSEVERSGVKRALRSLVQRLRRARGKCREARQTLMWVEEILAWEVETHGRTFPFVWSALEFYGRCEKVGGALEAVLHRPGRRANGSPYLQLEKALQRLRAPAKRGARLTRDLPALRERWGWFERTRRVLGYRNGPVPLSPKGTLSEEALERGRRRQDWLEG